MTPLRRLTDPARLAWHLSGSVKDFWSSDLNLAAIELVDPQPGEVVVDLGAGLGPASVEAIGLVGPTGRVIAVEPSRTMRALLRLRCLGHRDLRAVDVRDGTAESLPVGATSVDALWAVNATHHFADLERFTAQLVRVLRPGGRVILVEEDLNHRFAQQDGQGHHRPHAIDVEALLVLFRSAGLTDSSSTSGVLAGTTATVITSRKAG